MQQVSPAGRSLLVEHNLAACVWCACHAASRRLTGPPLCAPPALSLLHGRFCATPGRWPCGGVCYSVGGGAKGRAGGTQQLVRAFTLQPGLLPSSLLVGFLLGCWVRCRHCRDRVLLLLPLVVPQALLELVTGPLKTLLLVAAEDVARGRAAAPAGVGCGQQGLLHCDTMLDRLWLRRAGQ
jgi:hypothetical protein